MKKLFLVLFALFSLTRVNAQYQPMALLPEAMRVAGFNSLCMDLFADAPTAKAVYEVPGAAGRTVSGIGHDGNYRHLDLRGAGDVVSKTSATFLKTSEHVTNERLEEFVRLKIDAYRNTDIKTNIATQNRLQNEVWAYNVLEAKGYVSHLGGVLDDYKNAVKHYKWDYGLRKPGVSDITLIGEIEHSYKKMNLAFDVKGTYVMVKDFETLQTKPFKYITHDLTYEGEEYIIANNAKTIIGVVERQPLTKMRTMRLEIKPNSEHTRHTLVVHVTGQADMSIPLNNNDHAVLYKPSEAMSATA